MTTDNSPPRDEIKLADLLRPLIGRGRLILRGTIIATLVAVLLGGAYFILQPASRSASLEFRPAFEGAQAGKYPNGLAFAPTDIVNPSIVEQVFTRNHIEEYCPSDAFYSGLVIQESSPQLQFLNLDYQARLSDARLSPVERQRLQDEYVNRRATVERQYQLAFFHMRECAGIPEALIHKALGEILETWATDAQDRRGVLKVRVAVLSPGIFEQESASGENLLVRADLLRTAVGRVIANIAEVEGLPGAELVRGSDKRISFREVRAELEDLIQARLDPLVAQAGEGLGRDAGRWISQALQASTIRLHAAQQRTEAYRGALREYSGIAAIPSTVGRPEGEQRQSSSDVQALTPQIDRTFIDRIVELSDVNTTFRQEITRETIRASVDAINRGAVVEQYRQLATAVASSSFGSIPRETVSKTLVQVANQAKEATRRFNEIYDEFSRTSLRAGPAMYRTERPPQASTIRSFGLRNFMLAVVGVMLATPLLLMIALLLQHHVRRFIESAR